MVRSLLTTGILLLLYLTSCNEIKQIIRPASPHEKYEKRLAKAGLDKTAMVRQWQQAASTVLLDSLRIELPYKETGYFFLGEIDAVAFSFTAKRGDKLRISLTIMSEDSFQIFTDLFEVQEEGALDDVSYLKEDDTLFEYEVGRQTQFILRLQPELLKGGRYSLTIESAPSLMFPVAGKNSKSIQSFWGAPRNGGGRSHEGVDIFAPRGTPVVASMDGSSISRAGVNRLGGNVIFLFGDGMSLYYAHLDSQSVKSGQRVKAGDTIGLVGNSGNAAHTAPHLHFGIYARGEGAIDPLAFIDDIRPTPAEPRLGAEPLGEYKSTSPAKASAYSNMSKKPSGRISLGRNSPFVVNAVHRDYYRVTFPDGNKAFIKEATAKEVVPFDKISVKEGTPVFTSPTRQADLITILYNDTALAVSATFNGYEMTTYKDHYVWVQQPKK